ncbi:uncharacterized protein LOC125860882 [Solanum stenotomum]|uniref:uncharacterized protein LOC125860882 n=1 Tax=Solanum stenotomum TaxID=172797 RepID=UPI0020D1E4C2|nr:uncharacterized protein LOC125860882 [Solanum stenotomum]
MYAEMPKQNQYKNMFKSAASSSLAPGQSSLFQPQAQASSSSSQSKTSQHVPSSSSDGDSSQSVVPYTFDGVSSKPTTRKDNEDNHDWFVDVIDQHQVTKTVRMKIRDVHNMEKGLRIIVECDEYAVPIGKAAGIIAGVMGQLATNALYFPISFKEWPDMPDSYLDRVFDEILMARFLFMIDHQKAKKWAGSNLNKKWKDHWHKLWHAAKNPLLSKEEIIRKSPNGIPMDQ